MVRGRRDRVEAGLVGSSAAVEARRIRTAAVEVESVGIRSGTEEVEARHTRCYIEVAVKDFDTVCMCQFFIRTSGVVKLTVAAVGIAAVEGDHRTVVLAARNLGVGYDSLGRDSMTSQGLWSM